MAVLFDAASNVGTPVGTQLSWTHTPVGTPRAVVVFVTQNVGTADEVTGVTYGGTAMTEVSGSPNLHTTGEPGVVYAFFLGSGILTGARTVVVSVSGTGSIKTGTAISYTANTNVLIAATDVTIDGDALTNPSATFTTPAGIDTPVVIGFHSGQQQVTGVTPLSGWTSRLEFDFGSQVGGVYTLDTNTTAANVTAGWTQAAEDAVAIALALRETPISIGPVSESLTLNDSATAGRFVWVWDGTITILAPFSGVLVTVSDDLNLIEWTSQQIPGISTDVDINFCEMMHGLVTVNLIFQGSSNQVRAIVASNSSGQAMRFAMITSMDEAFVIIPDGAAASELALSGNIKVTDGTGCTLRVA